MIKPGNIVKLTLSMGLFDINDPRKFQHPKKGTVCFVIAKPNKGTSLYDKTNYIVMVGSCVGYMSLSEAVAEILV